MPKKTKQDPNKNMGGPKTRKPDPKQSTLTVQAKSQPQPQQGSAPK